mmetsp:Transcript_29852/g.39717  ORF Transcript_29852/g.39717 Transcript_29852/m.39717 type:complete len:408 (+) Transcript_29852:58-1281(+)
MKILRDAHSTLMTPITFLMLTLLPSIFLMTGVEAWGKEGHEIIANIAYNHVSPKVQSILNDIVLHDKGKQDEAKEGEELTPLAKVANWADKVRIWYPYKWSSPLHFVDIRDDVIEGGCHPPELMNDVERKECVFMYERDCVEDKCAVGAIVNYTNQVAMYYQQLEVEDVVEEEEYQGVRGVSHQDNNNDDTMYHLVTALKFLTHFMGDVHQPLHVSRTSDRGGNTIGIKIVHPHKHYYSYPVMDRYGNSLGGDDKDHPHHYSHNLHSIWDKTIIEHAIQKYYNHSMLSFQQSITAMDIFVTQKQNACMDARDVTCVSTWAQESWNDALQYAYATLNGKDIVNGMEITEEYLEERLVVVKERLGLAGLRLAYALEMALGDDVMEDGGGGVLGVFDRKSLDVMQGVMKI